MRAKAPEALRSKPSELIATGVIVSKGVQVDEGPVVDSHVINGDLKDIASNQAHRFHYLDRRFRSKVIGDPVDIGREEAQQSARKAQTLIQDRMTINSTYGVYLHAQQQLQQILELLRSEPLPEESARSFVNIGLMAVKELEASDTELANALMAADHAFKHAK